MDCYEFMGKIQEKASKSFLWMRFFGHVHLVQVLELGTENEKPTYHLVDHFRHSICIDRKGKEPEDNLKRFRPAHGDKTTWREKILTATDGAAFFNYIMEANLTSKEREILSECNDCALMIYSLPLMVGSGGVMMWLQLNSYVKTTKWLRGRLAYIPKLVLAVSGAYVIGQYHYWAGQDCPRRFLEKIPSSHASLVLRKRFPQPTSTLEPKIGKVAGQIGKQFVFDCLATSSQSNYLLTDRCELFPWDVKPASVEDILQAEVNRGRLKIEVKHN